MKGVNVHSPEVTGWVRSRPAVARQVYGKGGAEPAALCSVAFFTAPHPLQLQMHLHFLFCGPLLCLRISDKSHSHYPDLPSGKPAPHRLNTQLLFRTLTLVIC